jgi:hypothetical protein
MQPIAVLDRDAQIAQQRACETSKALLRRYCPVAVVVELGQLRMPLKVDGSGRGSTDIVVRANEDQVIGVLEEPPHGGYLRGCRPLVGPQ